MVAVEGEGPKANRGRGSGGRGRGRGAHTARLVANQATAPATVATPTPQLVHVPTPLELSCDPADIKMILDLYGSRGRTIINVLLSFDSYFY